MAVVDEAPEFQQRSDVHRPLKKGAESRVYMVASSILRHDASACSIKVSTIS